MSKKAAGVSNQGLADLRGLALYPKRRCAMIQLPAIRAKTPTPMTETKDFLSTLRRGGILLDGGMGSSLLKLGLKSSELALACLEHPSLVEQVHRGFLQAGSDWIQTNSFGANRLALESAGSGVSVGALNRTAAQLARGQARAHGSGWVAGNVGPAAAWAEPSQPLSERVLAEVYEEQVLGLLQGGVDLFSLETFGSSAEACLAIESVRRASDLPILASLTFIEEGGEFQSLTGEPLLQALLHIQEAGADGVGVNCAAGSRQTLACIETLVGKLQVPLSAKPNAGLPIKDAAGVAYAQEPQQFARDMLAALELGVCAVGGCCGADAQFIQALRVAMDESRAS